MGQGFYRLCQNWFEPKSTVRNLGHCTKLKTVDSPKHSSFSIGGRIKDPQTRPQSAGPAAAYTGWAGRDKFSRPDGARAARQGTHIKLQTSVAL